MWIKSDFKDKINLLEDSEIENFLDSNIIHSWVLNTILNSNKINDPKKTVYISSLVRDFFIKNDKNELKTNLKHILFSFYDYVEYHLNKNNTSFKDISIEFCNAIRNHNTNLFDNLSNEELFLVSFSYIYKLFIYNSLLWIYVEQEIMDEIQSIIDDEWLSKEYSIFDKISWYEDNQFCVDFCLKYNWNNILWFQVKPISFIFWLSSTTKFSFEKIQKANTNNKNYLAWEYWIHIIYYNNNDLYFRDVNDIDNEYHITELFKYLQYRYE